MSVRSVLAPVLLWAALPFVASAESAPLDLARRAADWQLAHLTDSADVASARHEAAEPQGWSQATFFIGLTALADRVGSYGEFVRAHGEQAEWRLGPKQFDADDQAIGQTYLWAARKLNIPAASEPLRQQLDRILADPPHNDFSYGDPVTGQKRGACRSRWCWADALFMAPPLWLELGRMTGDRRYAAYADSEFWAAAAVLYDGDEHLFYRDSRFRTRRDESGDKIFWSRGNGWVLAGLARILDRLPADHPNRGRYLGLYRDMAARLLSLQKPDGFWPASLIGGQALSDPETSGTSLFVFGLGWGIKQGILTDAAYLRAVKRGWLALSQSVRSDGRLGWVQSSGDAPGPVAAADTRPYGVGAFLLAASAVEDLRAAGQLEK